jgi:hypothetical protein
VLSIIRDKRSSAIYFSVVDMKNLPLQGISLIGKHLETADIVSFHEQAELMKCIIT